MFYRKVALAYAPALFALALGGGHFQVQNHCGCDIYFVHQVDDCGDYVTVPANATSDPIEFKSKIDGGGPSVKTAIVTNICSSPAPPISQFEYTQNPDMDMVFTDMSNINGIPYPFIDGGIRLTSSDTKVHMPCHKGIINCTYAYNTPFEDHATVAAGLDSDLLFETCWDNPGVQPGSGGSAPQESTPASSSVSAPTLVADTSDEPENTQPAEEPHDHSGPKEEVQPSSEEEEAPPSPEEEEAPVAIKQKVNVDLPSPSPTPSSVPAPAKDDNEAVVVVTVTETAPTVIETVHFKKREHVHKHVHNKINKKRHGV